MTLLRCVFVASVVFSALATNATASNELPVTVYERAGIELTRPVTGGVPLREGAAPRGAAFSLCDEAGVDIPLQTSVLARWQDDSVRWVLLDFQSSPPPNGSARYTLSWDTKPAEGTTSTSAPKGVSIGRAEGALLNMDDRVDVDLRLTNGEGQVCNAVVETMGSVSPAPPRGPRTSPGWW